MFLAVVHAPDAPDALQRAALVTGQALADVRRRLAGVFPRVLAADADVDAIARMQRELHALGFLTVAFDPLRVPGDDARLIARGLEIVDGELVIVTGTGVETRHYVPVEAVRLLQRAHRGAPPVAVTTSERKFSGGRALLSGGLIPTKRVEKTVTVAGDPPGELLLLQRDDSGPEVILYERRLSYRFLGPRLGPLSRANFETTIALVRAAVPDAPLDDRVSRPGFVGGAPPCARDPLDVALHLIWLAHQAA